MQLLFGPTTLGEVVKWTDITDPASALRFCKTVTVWIDLEMRLTGGEKDVDQVDQVDQVRITTGVLQGTIENATSSLCCVCSVFSSTNLSHCRSACPLRKMPDYDNFWKNYTEGKMVSLVQGLLVEDCQNKTQKVAVEPFVSRPPLNSHCEQKVQELRSSLSRKRRRGREEMYKYE